MTQFHNNTESWLLLLEAKYLSRISYSFLRKINIKLISVPVTHQKLFIHNINIKNFS